MLPTGSRLNGTSSFTNCFAKAALAFAGIDNLTRDSATCARFTRAMLRLSVTISACRSLHGLPTSRTRTTGWQLQSCAIRLRLQTPSRPTQLALYRLPNIITSFKADAKHPPCHSSLPPKARTEFAQILSGAFDWVAFRGMSTESVEFYEAIFCSNRAPRLQHSVDDQQALDPVG